MLVEKGVPNEKHLHYKQALDTGVSASPGVGKSAGKRRAGLPDDEACAEEDDDEDDIPRRRQSTSCQLRKLQSDAFLELWYCAPSRNWDVNLMGQVR